MFSPSRCTIRL